MSDAAAMRLSGDMLGNRHQDRDEDGPPSQSKSSPLPTDTTNSSPVTEFGGRWGRGVKLVSESVPNEGTSSLSAKSTQHSLPRR